MVAGMDAMALEMATAISKATDAPMIRMAALFCRSRPEQGGHRRRIYLPKKPVKTHRVLTRPLSSESSAAMRRRTRAPSGVRRSTCLGSNALDLGGLLAKAVTTQL